MLQGPDTLVNQLFVKLQRLSSRQDNFLNIKTEIEALERAQVNWAVQKNIFGQNLAHICALRGLSHILLHLYHRAKERSMPLALSFIHPIECYTPLHLACAQGNAPLVEVILSLDKSAVNLPDQFGMTPAHLVQASFLKAESKQKLFDLLKRYGADFTIRNHAEKTVAEVRSRGYFALPLCLNVFKQTPCHFVHFSQVRIKLEAKPILLVRGMVNYGDANKHTPLMQMALVNSVEGTNFLLAKGADVNQCDYQQRSALFYAAAFACTAIIQRMLDEGGDPLLADESGVTPIKVARIYGREDIVNLFERHLKILEEEQTNIFHVFDTALSAVTVSTATTGLQNLRINRSTVFRPHN